MNEASARPWPEIWFMRHGQTEWNAAGRIQGRMDSPLTPLGRRQAEGMAHMVREIAALVAAGPGGIFVSPLGRARQTAALALPDHPWTADPRLAEIGTGAWEGRLKADIRQGRTDLATYTSAPGGETLDDLMARVRSFADCLAGPSIVVGHGMWGQVLRGLATGLEPQQMGAQDNAQGCIYHLKDGREERLATTGF